MNRYSPLSRFRYPYKPVHDQVRRHRAIHKEQLAVLKPVRCELPRVVRLLVQPHYGRYVVGSEVLVVVLWTVEVVAAVDTRTVVRPGECQHLARDYPVEVAVFHFLEKIIKNDNIEKKQTVVSDFVALLLLSTSPH